MTTWLEILTLALELIAGLVLLAAVWLAPRVLDLDPEAGDGEDQH